MSFQSFNFAHLYNKNMQNLLTKIRFRYNSAPFKPLRIYRHKTLLQLTNALLVNRVANSPWMVANSSRLYKISCTFLSTRLTNFVIQKTFGKVFTGGETLDDVAIMSADFRKRNIPVIIDYCGEGFIDQASNQAQLDKNAEMFRLTAEDVSKFPNQMISIKVSGLVDMQVLRKLNTGVVKIRNFWAKHSNNNLMTAEQLLVGFQEIYGGTDQQDITQFLSTIFGYTGQIEEFKCDQLEFKSSIHPYYLHDQTKTKSKLIHLFCALSLEQQTQVDNLIRRIDKIIDPYSRLDNGFKIIVDAEQSYIQSAIFSISEQYQAKYNKQKIYIVPTMQNYLKYSVERIKYEIEFAKRKNLVFSMKYVRGAYLVEERRLAKQQNYESPIVENFEATTVNFLSNMKAALQADLKKGSQLIVASHSQQTIQQVQQLQKEVPSDKSILYAQLLGLADHLTIQLNKQGYTVYKYIPYGTTGTMVPYLIRRAQQLSQMKYPLTLQYELITDQFAHRLALRS